MSTPLVPPRPTRASAGGGPTAVKEKDSIPAIPTRPVRKHLDPAVLREEHVRSPLNELPHPVGGQAKRRSLGSLAPTEVPQRPPIANMPSVGQEGLEYASYDQLPPEAQLASSPPAHTSRHVAEPEQTRNVSANMPLHAPKASIPQSTATSRIATVTHTDSTQAAAAGIGKAKPDDDVHKLPAAEPLARTPTRELDPLRRVPSAEPTNPLRSKTSFTRSTSSLQYSRPGSIHERDNHGIPEIGMQAPLNPNAGDVQAPSPAPTQSQFAPGIGFFNDGSARAHHRKRSSRQEFVPGAYGLHGHHNQYDSHDQFERDWIAKHPDQAAKEGYNVYGNLNVPRSEHALSSAELNKLVNQTTDGMGVNPEMVGTPSQEIAWSATQEYTSRFTSPRPSPAPLTERTKRPSSGSQHVPASPLRKASYPFGRRESNDEAIQSEDDVIHVPAAEYRVNKVTGGGPADGALDLGPHGGNTVEEGGWYEERGSGTPILASDEIIKRPGSAYMQPAVSPELTRDQLDEQYESEHGYGEGGRRNSLRIPSRPNSVHGEYHGGNLHRFMSHDEHHASGMGTPLEEIEEYEPLFPEDEDQNDKPKAVVKKRPGLEHHHFPSQDIWEDTPLSLQYSTTVETPDLPPGQKAVAPPPSEAPSSSADATSTSTFESPEAEQRRRDANPHDMTSDRKTFVKPHFKPGVLDDLAASRPGVQRFPSQDIWEDTPDSMRLVTTVSSEQGPDDLRSPPGAETTETSSSQLRPSVPTRPARKSRLADEVATPSSPEKEKARPAIPDRPKPTVPARPARRSGSEYTDDAAADSSAAAAPSAAILASKPKPSIPARPAEKLSSALKDKAGFLSDLNNRLKLGPQAPIKTREAEPTAEAGGEEAAAEKDATPLADARKGRARGPARRKPAPTSTASSSAAASTAAAAGLENGVAKSSPLALSMFTPTTMWSIDESDELQVATPKAEAPAAAEDKSELPTAESAEQHHGQADEEEDSDLHAKLEKVLSENEERNTAEPPLTNPVDETGTVPSSSSTAAKDETALASASTREDMGKQPVDAEDVVPPAQPGADKADVPIISATTAATAAATASDGVGVTEEASSAKPVADGVVEPEPLNSAEVERSAGVQDV